MTRFIDGFASVWLIFWLSFFAVYIHFGGLAFAGLVILLGAVGWPIWLLRRQTFPILQKEFTLPIAAFALFFAWLGVTSLWSDLGSETAFRLAGQMALTISIPTLILTRSLWRRNVLSHILMAMALAGVAVLALDVASGYGVGIFFDPVGADGDLNARQNQSEMNIGRGHVVYAYLTPLLIALFATHLPHSRRWPAVIIFTALVLIGTMLNRLAIAPVIMLAAAPLFLIGFRSPRWGLRLSLGTFAASILFAPIIGIASRMAGEGVLVRLPLSWDHRLRMWDYSLARISDSPWLGNGLDSSRTFQDAFTTRIGVDVPYVSLHPHNIGLQTWVEAGFMGAALLTIAIITLYRPLRRLIGDEPWRAAAVSSLVMGAAVASAVTVGAWQYWWWGLIGLSLSLVLLIPNEVD